MTMRIGVALAAILVLSALTGCETRTRRQIVEASLDTILLTQLEEKPWYETSGNRRVNDASCEIAKLVTKYENVASMDATKLDAVRLVLPDFRSSPTTTDIDGVPMLVWGDRPIQGYDAQRTLIRNQIGYNLLAHIRAYHESIYDDLYEGVATSETLVDWSVLALSAAGSFASGGASQVYSGIAGGLTGARAAATNNFLNDLSKFQVMLEMEALRADTRADILRRMSLPDSEYPLVRMAKDMQDLLEDGSIRHAVTQTARQSVSKLTEAIEREQRSLDALQGIAVPRQ
ncbi:MAG: hypothetical protein AAF432_13710 [Planctomycetota bacterium]